MSGLNDFSLVTDKGDKGDGEIPVALYKSLQQTFVSSVIYRVIVSCAENRATPVQHIGRDFSMGMVYTFEAAMKTIFSTS